MTNNDRNAVRRRTVLAGLGVSVLSAPVLALPASTDAPISLPKAERLRALDAEFANAFEHANAAASTDEGLVAMMGVMDLNDRFDEAAKELWETEPQSLDDLAARGVCAFHYQREMRGRCISYFHAHELRRSHEELTRAVLSYVQLDRVCAGVEG
ncbi:MAG: hypothetical protein ABS54_10085 [Hyphomicrobium sp. SCN 65-11]|nr:MAG: hypothetical protein ABS54_10085 [Hyphomicrobium sp. SCN 65-11]